MLVLIGLQKASVWAHKHTSTQKLNNHNKWTSSLEWIRNDLCGLFPQASSHEPPLPLRPFFPRLGRIMLTACLGKAKIAADFWAMGTSSRTLFMLHWLWWLALRRMGYAMEISHWLSRWSKALKIAGVPTWWSARERPIPFLVYWKLAWCWVLLHKLPSVPKDRHLPCDTSMWDRK